MKTKQKLVIALATLTAGVLAAGATSTVAWFVANREATFSYNTITVNANAGDLKIKYGGSIKNGETDSGHTYGYSDSVTMTGTNLQKLVDLSSSDGSNFVKAQQQGSNISFVSATDGWLTFYVALQNEATETANIWLKGSGCAITNGTDMTAADDVRVAVDNLGTSVPTAKGTTKVTFMDGGTAKTYATTSDTATYVPATSSSSATVNYTTTLATNSAIVLDINAAENNYYLGQIAAKTDNTPGVGYVVVTVWYEGTNKAIQNEDIGHNFSLALDFLVDNVTATN